MKIEITKEKLFRALSKTERATQKNASLPVLQCFLLSTEKGILTVTATNLDLGVQVSTPVKMIQPGKVAVPATLLTGLIGHTPNSEVITLMYKDTTLEVHTPSRNATIQTVAHEEFPSLPLVSSATVFNVPIHQLINGFRSVWFSASTSTIKPEIAAVYMFPEKEELVFVATDAFRLAEKRIPISGAQDIPHILIPNKNIPDLIRVFEGEDGEVEVQATENQIGFTYNDTYITSRVIDGSFPEYQQLIPKNITTEATFLKDDIMNALKATTVFSGKFNQISKKVEPTKKRFEIKSQTADVGENTETVDAVLQGEDLEINFNHKYIIDGFQAIPTDSVVFQYSGPNTPMVIQGAGDSTFRYLVMPMQVQG